MLVRGGLLAKIGEHNLFWSSEQPILAAEARPCAFCQHKAKRRLNGGHRHFVFFE